MINRMSRELETRLKAKSFPFEVYYDSDRFNRQPNRTCVVVRRNTDSVDRFVANLGSQRNPRRMSMREIAVSVDVFAKSGVAGARRADHECLSDQIVDAVNCALLNWGQEKKMPVSFNQGRFLAQEELADSVFSSWPGTVYSIDLTVSRGVVDTDFDGEGLGEVELDDTSTNFEASGPTGNWTLLGGQFTGLWNAEDWDGVSLTWPGEQSSPPVVLMGLPDKGRDSSGREVVVFDGTQYGSLDSLAGVHSGDPNRSFTLLLAGTFNAPTEDSHLWSFGDSSGEDRKSVFLSPDGAAFTNRAP